MPRRSLAASASILALCVALTACDGGPTGPLLEPEVQTFVDQMNDHRISVGCPALEWDESVAVVAHAHSQDMLDRAFFAHTNPDGLSPFDRLRDAGIGYSRAAENIAWGYPSAEAVLQGWLGSPGHRANLENCALTRHGVGLVGTYWTHLFVTP